jgi:hypothetical protein
MSSRIYTFVTSSGLALGSTRPSVYWMSGASSLGVKWLKHGADQLPPSRFEVPIRLHGVVLKQRGNFISLISVYVDNS